MNGQDFMKAWEGHEFNLCLDHATMLSRHQLERLCEEIPDTDLHKLSSVFFFARQITEGQASAYAALLNSKFRQVSKDRCGKGLDIAAEACYRLSLSVPELMEWLHLRGSCQAKQDIFHSYTFALSCLKTQAEASGPDLIKRGMADRWAEALSYDFSMVETVDKDVLAFINKMVALRSDRIGSTMIYCLKQQANQAPIDQRAATFAIGISSMIEMLRQHDLVVVPKDVEPFIKEIDGIAEYFHNQDIAPIAVARNALLRYFLDPEQGGRWLGNSYSKSGRKPLDLTQIRRIGVAIDKALEKPISSEVGDLCWRHKVGLINAIGRLQGTSMVIENAVVGLIKDCEDDQLKTLLSLVTSKAAVIMARGIGRKMPERVSLVTPKLGEKIFAIDLGL